MKDRSIDFGDSLLGPENHDVIRREDFVMGHNNEIFYLCLRNQHAIKGIAMMRR